MARIQTRGPQLLDDMRDWIADTFPYDAPDDLTDDEVIEAIARHYLGGIVQFKEDGL